MTTTAYITRPLRANGQVIIVVNVGRAAVNRYTVVSASISEVLVTTEPPSPVLNVKPFLGAATMTIHNVVPDDNGTIAILATIDWGVPLNFAVYFTLTNP